MKVALITDTHHGIRNDAVPFLDMTQRFISDIVIPEIRKQNVQRVVHLGDILDRRKYINYNTASRLRRELVIPLLREVERFDLILGNHDVYHKNTNELNGPEELWSGLIGDQFRVHGNTTEAFLGDLKVLFVPWITDNSREGSLKLIEETNAQVCFGHLELEGFEMYRGHPSLEGLSPTLFHKFDVTCSGHFHHKSSKNGIHFLGSHGEFTWADYNDERGFHVFDTETRELEFIQNPYTMFEKIHYSDDESGFVDHPDIEGKYVKVIVSSRGDQILFEQFISNLEACNPVEVQVVDDHLNAGDALDSMEEVDESEDTLSIFRKATELYEGDRTLMDSFITELYQEALAVE